MSNKKDFKAPEIPFPTELGAPTSGDTQGNFLQQHWDWGAYSHRTEKSLQPFSKCRSRISTACLSSHSLPRVTRKPGGRGRARSSSMASARTTGTISRKFG